MMLEVKGFDHDGANGGIEALDLIKRRLDLAVQGKARMYKLIFLDYSMPEMDGPMVSRAIRSLFKQHVHEGVIEPKIFCCTAYSEASYMREAFIAGMDKFLAKPLSSQDLDDCIKEVL